LPSSEQGSGIANAATFNRIRGLNVENWLNFGTIQLQDEDQMACLGR
jgi:hypothetical protein